MNEAKVVRAKKQNIGFNRLLSDHSRSQNFALVYHLSRICFSSPTNTLQKVLVINVSYFFGLVSFVLPPFTIIKKMGSWTKFRASCASLPFFRNGGYVRY